MYSNCHQLNQTQILYIYSSITITPPPSYNDTWFKIQNPYLSGGTLWHKDCRTVPCSWTWSFSRGLFGHSLVTLEHGLRHSLLHHSLLHHSVLVVPLGLHPNCLLQWDICRISFQFSTLPSWCTPLLCSWGSFPFIIVLTFDMTV